MGSLLSPPTFSSCKQSDLMPQAQAVPPHKRKRPSNDACKADNSSHISSKRQRVDASIREARHTAREQYWNTLSKVWLTPRALREFDRRNVVRYREQTYTTDLELAPRIRALIDISQLTAASWKDLKRFARRGGPMLTDPRNCPEPLCSSSKSRNSHGSRPRGQKRSGKSSNTSSTSYSGATPKSSAYDRDFERKCIDRGMYMPSRRVKPANWQELETALARPRASLSPSQLSDGTLDRFCEAEAQARDKWDVCRSSLPTILGGRDRNQPSVGNVLFSNMDDMAPDAFKKVKPDIYYGVRPEQINRPVRQDLSCQIVPTKNDRFPIAPNFFLEVEGPDGSALVKRRRACYNGATGARAMHALQCYGQAEPTYDNKAYTITSTYHNGSLEMYAHRPTRPQCPGGPVEYHMTNLGGWTLTGSSQTFRDGVGAFRNARDHAGEQRKMLIDQANGMTRTPSADITSLSDSNSQDTVTSLRGRSVDSATSADELTLDNPSAASRSKRQKTRETERQPRSTAPH